MEGPPLPKVQLFAIPFMQADPVQRADPGDRLSENNLSLDIEVSFRGKTDNFAPQQMFLEGLVASDQLSGRRFGEMVL